MDRAGNTWWRRIAFTSVALGLLFFLSRGWTRTSTPPSFDSAANTISTATSSATSSATSGFISTQGHRKPQFLQEHEFDGLTDEQCLSSFPDLYYEVERGVKYWQEKGHVISANDTEISWRKWDGMPMGSGSGGAMRILVHDNELRLLESEGSISHWGYRGRAMGFLYLLQRAIDSASSAGEALPTVEFALVFEDIVDLPYGEDGTHSFWTWTSHIDDRTHDRHWLIPNYDLWYGAPMGSFREARRRAVERDQPFTQKIPKAVWRGSGFLNPDIRNKLVEVSEGKPWSDIIIADWGGGDSADYVSVEDMCRYALVVHTEGVSYSGRLSYLQNCNSLLIFHDLEWRTFSTHLLTPDGPGQNYVKVGRDWAELDERATYFLEHPHEAERIIANSLDTFRNRYMTRPAVSCYFRQLIKGYSKVSEKPPVNRKKQEGQNGSYRRGISFERFLDSPQDGNFESKEWH